MPRKFTQAPSAGARWSAALMAAAILLVGCGSDDPANLGVAGASCLRTPDCSAPLQCVANVCTDVGDATAVGAAADASGGGPEPSQADASEARAPDYRDIREQPDIDFPFDLPVDAEPSRPDVTSAATPVFDDCGGLGIAHTWRGLFEGVIVFDLDTSSFPGLMERGTLLVDGDLGFEIRCIEKKLVVAGTLEGTGVAEGQAGRHPFAAHLSGDYDPETGRIETFLREGEVRIFGLVEVYFEGSLNGDLVNGTRFEGDWDGRHTGNNVGIQGTADGDGTWFTLPQN